MTDSLPDTAPHGQQDRPTDTAALAVQAQLKYRCAECEAKPGQPCHENGPRKRHVNPHHYRYKRWISDGSPGSPAWECIWPDAEMGPR